MPVAGLSLSAPGGRHTVVPVQHTEVLPRPPGTGRALPPIQPPGRSVQIRGRRYPVLLPSVRDSRLHVAATITTLHVLGQVYFGFELAVSQILVALATCAVLETAVTFHRAKVIAWPASALLTGNGIAFLLRVPGTPHGDLWTWHGTGVYAAVAAAALLTKYLVRVRDRPLFNPSNIALVGVFVLLGSERVDPLDLWWAPPSPPLAAAYLVILVGGIVVGRRQGMVGMTTAFLLTFATLLVPLAASGHCMSARWALDDVCGGDYYTAVALSPELLILAFFMITDPKSAPSGRVARVIFGVTVASVAVLLAAAAHTEYWTKVGLLAALVVGCLTRPLLDRLLPAGSRPAATAPSGWRAAAAGAVLVPVTVVATALLSPGLLGLGPAVERGSPARDGGDAGTAARGTGPMPGVRMGPELAALGAGRPDRAAAERIVRDVYGTRPAGSASPGGTAGSGPPATGTVELTIVRNPSRRQDKPRLALRVPAATGTAVTYLLVRQDGRYALGEQVTTDPADPAGPASGDPAVLPEGQ